MELAVFLITSVLRGKGKALGKNNAANALWDKKQFPGRELMTFRKSIDPNKTHTHTIWKRSTKLRDGKIGHNLRVKCIWCCQLPWRRHLFMLFFFFTVSNPVTLGTERGLYSWWAESAFILYTCDLFQLRHSLWGAWSTSRSFKDRDTVH